MRILYQALIREAQNLVHPNFDNIIAVSDHYSRHLLKPALIPEYANLCLFTLFSFKF